MLWPYQCCDYQCCGVIGAVAVWCCDLISATRCDAPCLHYQPPPFTCHVSPWARYNFTFGDLETPPRCASASQSRRNNTITRMKMKKENGELTNRDIWGTVINMVTCNMSEWKVQGIALKPRTFLRPNPIKSCHRRWFDTDLYTWDLLWNIEVEVAEMLLEGRGRDEEGSEGKTGKEKGTRYKRRQENEGEEGQASEGKTRREVKCNKRK